MAAGSDTGPDAVPASPYTLTDRRKLFDPPKGDPRWVSHAQGPTVLKVDDKTWRVYVAGRDANNQSRIFFVDLDPDTLSVTATATEPALDLGPDGTFDRFGVGPGWAVRTGDRILMYYTGAGPALGAPYLSAIGLAESRDGGRTFQRLGSAPVLGASRADPFGVATPTVFRRGGSWIMWYSSFREWRDVDGRPEPIYDIRSARSVDGESWTADDALVLGFADETEGGLVRAQPVGSGEDQFLLACARGWRDFRQGENKSYRFVFARENDDTGWTRTPDICAWDPAPGPSDWDGGMQSYPWLVEDAGRQIVFYNGNDFGRSGFGCARLNFTREDPAA
ncbi:MAG: hypothetical protein ACWA5A_12295 [Marinibacterium sp.]